MAAASTFLTRKNLRGMKKEGGRDNFKKVAKENFRCPQLQIIHTCWHIIHIGNVT